MIAEIIATGDEIRSGALVDSNSAYIAERLEQIGVAVTRHHSVGDDMAMLVELFHEVGARADIAVLTGGLGPTTDDLTSEAAAQAAGSRRVLDPRALEAIEAFFKKRNRPMIPSNKKQAMFPEGARRLDNPIGTAPGFMMTLGRCTFFCLPGVPPEMHLMVKEQVLPRIKTLMGEERRIYLVKTLSTFGMTESMTGEKVSGFTDAFPDIKIGFRARFPEIHVKFYLEGEDREKLDQMAEKATDWITEKLGHYLISKKGESMERVVGRLLAEKGATLALAESCTGGLIASRITDVPGSSDYFFFSAVTYSNDAKVQVLGVSPKTLESVGAVHEETAKEMAVGARDRAGADYGLSVSGIAGPSGGTDDKPVGTVCIGLATPTGAKGYRYLFPFGKRLMNKSIFATSALDLLRRELSGITRNEA